VTSRILIADPVATNRIVLKARLAAALYEVDVAASRPEAVRFLKQNSYEAVMVAGELVAPQPGSSEDSADLIALSKANPDRDVTVICMQDHISGDHATTWEHVCFALGADECLSRPISSELLLARLRNLMRDTTRRADLPMAHHGGKPIAVEYGAQIIVARVGTPEAVPLPNQQSVLAQQLTAHLGAEHRVQDRPVAAMSQASPGAPDILILDASEAAVDQAVTLLPQIHSSALLRDTRIILRLAEATPTQLAAAFDFGAHEAVGSDVAAEQLAIRVQRQAQLQAQELSRKSRVRDQLRLAITDPLTGLHNRRYAMEYLNRLVVETQQSQQDFALLSLDIDHFKSINDRYGHATGDSVLTAVAACLQSNLRGGDLVARSGGEEFVIAQRAQHSITGLQRGLSGADQGRFFFGPRVMTSSRRSA